MIKENQPIKVKWWVNNKDYYISKGYKFTKFKDEFYVDAKDLNMGASDKIVCICDICASDYTMDCRKYYNRLKKYGKSLCQKCANSRNDLEERQEDHYRKIIVFCNEHGYTLISKKEDIITYNSEIIYICPDHGEVHTTVTSILQGKLCYRCSRRIAYEKRYKRDKSEREEHNRNRCIEICRNEDYELSLDENDFSRIENYINYTCKKHGVFKMKIANMLSGKRCPECAKEIRSERCKLSIDEVIKRVSECGGIVLNPEEYINNTAKNLKIICPECGDIFITSLRNFTQHGGQVCEKCRSVESVGEKKVRHYLENNNIEFIQQKWFSDCRDINPLPFDFYLPNKNSCIEFDGSQHFRDNGFFTYRLETTQKHDSIKNNYCANNGINLIRIPYWQIDNISNILDKELNFT